MERQGKENREHAKEVGQCQNPPDVGWVAHGNNIWRFGGIRLESNEMNECQKPEEHNARGQPIPGPQPATDSEEDAPKQESENTDEGDGEDVWLVRASVEGPTAVVPVWIETTLNHEFAADGMVEEMQEGEEGERTGQEYETTAERVVESVVTAWSQCRRIHGDAFRLVPAGCCLTSCKSAAGDQLAARTINASTVRLHGEPRPRRTPATPACRLHLRVRQRRAVPT